MTPTRRKLRIICNCCGRKFTAWKGFRIHVTKMHQHCDKKGAR